MNLHGPDLLEDDGRLVRDYVMDSACLPERKQRRQHHHQPLSGPQSRKKPGAVFPLRPGIVAAPHVQATEKAVNTNPVQKGLDWLRAYPQGAGLAAQIILAPAVSLDTAWANTGGGVSIYETRVTLISCELRLSRLSK